MNFLELAQTRYTTKRYDSTKKVSDDKIQQLEEIMHLCPSSINSQPWTFTFIANQDLKNELAKHSYFNEHKVQQASHLVVFSVLDSVDYFEQNNLQTLPEPNVEYFKNMRKIISEDQIKAWFKNQVYLSLGYFLSACASMQIDSTPMEGIDTKAYDEILKASTFKTVFAATIGYRASDDDNQISITPKSRLDINKVIENR